MKDKQLCPKLIGTGLFYVDRIRFRKSSSTTWVFFVLILLAGCQMSDPIIEKIIQEMDSVYFKNRNDDVTKVVQKYFVLGADFDEYLPLLNKLNDDGFTIREYRHGIVRTWPNGKFNSPRDERFKRRLERVTPEGTKSFLIKKVYIQMLIAEKVAVVVLKVDVNGKLYEVSGRINVNSI